VRHECLVLDISKLLHKLGPQHVMSIGGHETCIFGILTLRFRAATGSPPRMARYLEHQEAPTNKRVEELRGSGLVVTPTRRIQNLNARGSKWDRDFGPTF